MIKINVRIWRNIAGESTRQLLHNIIKGQIFVIFLSFAGGVCLSCMLNEKTISNEIEELASGRLESWQYGLVLSFIVVLLVYIILGLVRLVREIEYREEEKDWTSYSGPGHSVMENKAKTEAGKEGSRKEKPGIKEELK